MDRAPGEPAIARKINREVVLLYGWAPAILLQFAHPLVAAGVAEHSSFRAAPGERLRRLHSTLDAMLALTFGTPEQVARAVAGINAIHDRVHGELPDQAGVFRAGTAYSAHDPELLRWVHATMLALMPRTYELYVGPLSGEEKDTYCREASGVEALLGIPRGFLPRSVSELDAYLGATIASGEIGVTPLARLLARELLWPPFPLAAAPLLWLNRLAAVGLVPPAIRAAYGFVWSPAQARALRLHGLVTRAALRLTPAYARHWPASRQWVSIQEPVRRSRGAGRKIDGQPTARARGGIR